VSSWEEEESDGKPCGKVIEVDVKWWEVCACEEVRNSGAGQEAGSPSSCAMIRGG
jgi:hypothetical protein